MNQFVFAAITLSLIVSAFVVVRGCVAAYHNNTHKRRWLARAAATRNRNEQQFCKKTANRGAL